MTEKKPKNKHTLIVIVCIVILIIAWLLLRGNKRVQRFVQQNTPWALNLFPAANVVPTYDVNAGGYVPADMPALNGGSKCDSNSPCIFCTVPNATYPSVP